jgi:hypothetical protein
MKKPFPALRTPETAYHFWATIALAQPRSIF